MAHKLLQQCLTFGVSKVTGCGRREEYGATVIQKRCRRFEADIRVVLAEHPKPTEGWSDWFT